MDLVWQACEADDSWWIVDAESGAVLAGPFASPDEVVWRRKVD